MMAICLLDTSVFVEFLGVPAMSSRSREIVSEAKEKIKLGEKLFLPMATILEAGNHISQNGDGNQRRQCANRFVLQVALAIDGKSPFTPINFLEADDMRQWILDFPDAAMRGMGIGDLSIIEDWKRQRRLHRGRRVYIWSLDSHLQGYDTNPPAD